MWSCGSFGGGFDFGSSFGGGLGGSLRWVSCSYGDRASDTVRAGRDGCDVVYVARASHCGDLIPGKMLPSHRCCYVAYDGREHSKRRYEVLTNRFNVQLAWKWARDGEIPRGAVRGGRQCDGTPLYIGRAEGPNGATAVGKVHPRHGCLYIPYDGREVSIRCYQVLVVYD